MDPAEQRARELMRAVVGERDFEAYEQLGFVSVTGRNPRYAYLVYPYRPLVAYDTETASCSPSTASASPTTASGCRPPTTCSPSG